jgi:AcrR family transcriptional regulator
MRTASEVFSRKGYEAATLADIAAVLKVSPAAILRHTKSKQALFVESMIGGKIELPECVTTLKAASGTEDPEPLLRRFAEEMVPFLRSRIRNMLALQAHIHANPATFRPPAAVSSRTGAPARVLAILEDFFARASDAGTLKIDDARAAALLFLGALQSYVILHYVLQVAPRPYPLKRFLDTLFQIWNDGAFATRRKGGRHGTA